MHVRYLSAVITLLLMLQAAYGQAPGYKAYTPEDKDTRLLCLRTGRDGFLYCGGTNGIQRFDGIRFRSLPLVATKGTDTVTALFEDSRGQWWAGLSDGRIARGKPGSMQWLTPEEGTPRKQITAFTEDGAGHIWIGTAGEGLYYLRQERLYLLNEDDGLSDNNIHDLAAAANGTVLAATDQGLNTCSIQNGQKKIRVTAPAQGLPDYIVTALAPENSQRCWMGMQDGGICLLEIATGQITVPDKRNQWRYGQVNALRWEHGTLWIASRDSGLIAWHPGQGSFETMPAIPRYTGITALSDDPFGNLWLLAGNQGLVKTAANSLRLLPLYNPAYYNTVHALMVDRAGRCWTGTRGAVVRHDDNGNGYLNKRFPLPGLPPQSDITSLVEDPSGQIWIGTMGSGIWVLQPATGTCRQVPEIPVSSSILSLNGRGNTICAAGLEGAFILDLVSGSTSPRVTAYNNIENIGSRYIYSVYKDSRNRLWFATDGRGLTLLSNGQFSHFGEKEGIRDGHIYSVTEDSAGHIWFSTSQAGIYRFDGKQFTNYSIREGLSSMNISALKTDAQGNIVIAHSAGMDILQPATGQFTYVHTQAETGEVNDDLGAVCTDYNGNVYLAASGGVLRYTALAGTERQPRTLIAKVQLYLNDIDTSLQHRFSYDENNFSFHFTGLYYNQPGAVYYRYKLQGLSDEWELTADDSKIFPKLPPGNYVFRVQASLNRHFSHASEAAYAFTVAKPFWKTWWFLAGSITMLSALLILLIRRRENQLRHLERLQAEKARFEFEVLRNQVNPHFLFNSFNTLITTIEENPAAAVKYVEHLSDFFRNIVNYRHHDLISLREELHLLDNYKYLQQQRYGNYLQLLTTVDEPAMDTCFLPPLTMQLLLENAIKHNVVSKEATLRVHIRMDDGQLVVENNLNPKLHPEKGTGMGLQNIISRYALFSNLPVEVIKGPEYFTVKLPVLKK